MPRMLVLNYVTALMCRHARGRLHRRLCSSLFLQRLSAAAGLLLVDAWWTYIYTFSRRSYFVYYGPPPRPPTFSARVFEFLKDFVQNPGCWFGVMLMQGAGDLCILFRPRRARVAAKRGPTLLALWAFAIVPIVLLLATTACIWFLLYGVFEQREPVYAWMLAPILIAFFLTLLALDVHTMLRWVARNPIAEMSKRPFLPAKQ